MKETVEINKDDETVQTKKSKKRNVIGLYIGICFIIVGVIWYAVNTGLIPIEYLQSWPQIVLVIIGILILIKSL
ncbi:MAG: hypothetical protein ACP5C3_00130 [Methanomicrobiales archaeon]